MLRPHTIIKRITFTEEEWADIYRAARDQGADPVQFIKRAAAAATQETTHDHRGID